MRQRPSMMPASMRQVKKRRPRYARSAAQTARTSGRIEVTRPDLPMTMPARRAAKMRLIWVVRCMCGIMRSCFWPYKLERCKQCRKNPSISWLVHELNLTAIALRHLVWRSLHQLDIWVFSAVAQQLAITLLIRLSLLSVVLRISEPRYNWF